MSNVKMVQDAYAAFNRGDIPAVLGAMDAKMEWREAEGNPYQPSGAPWNGPDAVLHNLFMKMGADWDGFSIHPQKFHDAGSTIVVEGRYSGTCKKTGKALDAQVCHVFTIRDGKFISFQQFVNTAHLQDVMGARQ